MSHPKQGKVSITNEIILLRIFHGIAVMYLLFCTVYLYYAALTQRYDLLLVVCMVSLLMEAIVVYGFNKGDCPLIHIQRRIGDDKPFFELFLPAGIAKLVIPIASVIASIGVVVLIFGMMTIW